MHLCTTRWPHKHKEMLCVLPLRDKMKLPTGENKQKTPQNLPPISEIPRGGAVYQRVCLHNKLFN